MRSKWRCWISRPSPAWGISTRAKFFTWLAFTHKLGATVYQRNSTNAFISKWSRCWRWRLSTRVQRFPMEPTATRLTIPAGIRISIGFTIALVRSVPRARSKLSSASSNANARHFSARSVRRNDSHSRLSLLGVTKLREADFLLAVWALAQWHSL